MTAALLPPWHGPAEAALADLGAAILAIPAPIAPLWNAAICPLALLPWLAWTFDAEDFDPTAPEGTRRRVVAEAIQIHRQRGTRAGVRRALAASGLGDARLTERYGAHQFGDGTARDGATQREAADHWAEYRVTLTRPVTIAQAATARAVITRAAPARAHLLVVDFSAAALTFGAPTPRSGTYSRGYA